MSRRQAERKFVDLVTRASRQPRESTGVHVHEEDATLHCQ